MATGCGYSAIMPWLSTPAMRRCPRCRRLPAARRTSRSGSRHRCGCRCLQNGWPTVLGPGELMDVGAFLACGNRHIALRGPVADRVKAVAVIRGEGLMQPLETELTPSISGERDFTGSVRAPFADGTYNLAVELRSRQSGAVLLSTAPVAWRIARVTPTPTRPPAGIRLDQPRSPHRLPLAAAPLYDLPIRGRMLATPLPTSVFVVASGSDGTERFREALAVQGGGDFRAPSLHDACELLASDEAAADQAWRFDGTHAWLQDTYGLSFYVGNPRNALPPQALAAFPGIRIEIAPALRLRMPPDGYAESYSPGEKLEVRAYLTCGRLQVPLQDSPVADRLRAVALLQKTGF